MNKKMLCLALAIGALTGGLLTACGGDDDGEPEAEAATTHTLADLETCLEGAGQEVREVEVSFAKIPPDIGVSDKTGWASVWVAEDEAGVEEIVEQNESLSQLGDQSLPKSQLYVSDNAVVDISSSADEGYAETLGECLPPTE